MKNATVKKYAPNMEAALQMSLETLCTMHIAGGDIWIIGTQGKWYVTIATETTTGILMTDRKQVKGYSSLETAMKQLREGGVMRVAGINQERF